MSFLTFRRYYLDVILSSTAFHGKVLDIGGKKQKKRGSFRPRLDQVESWKYLNIDASTNPDYCCSAESVPVPAESFDIVLMTEVLEHLEEPEVALAECFRVLKKSGKLIATMPFLFPVHADPYDFQRWTPEKIKLELQKAGFSIETIKPMGSLFAVIYDLLHVSLGTACKSRRALKNRAINRVVMPVLAKVFLWLDKIYNHKAVKITTGYYVLAFKK